MLPRLHYSGPLRDSSGYGEAARNQISALRAAGYQDELSAFAIQFEPTDTTFGDAGAVAEHYLGRDKAGAEIVITHCIPPAYDNYKVEGAYNIAFTVWETDSIVPEWAEKMNEMNEIWTAHEEAKQAFIRSGVTVPITVIRHPIDLVDFSPNRPVTQIRNVEDDEFLFYNIGTWSPDRKNQHTLIRAYKEEFSGDEKVALFLKTYHHSRDNGGREIVMKEIREAADGGSDAKIVVNYGWELPHELMVGLHVRGDVYVSPHRGECPGLPILQAMACGNPAIATHWNSVSDFMTSDHGWPLDYTMTPVLGPSYWPYYNDTQSWADPDPCQLRESMRSAYENRKLTAALGRNARAAVVQRYNWASIGKTMVDRLKEISL